MKWFLDKGPQKKGGYPKKRRPNFSKKKFNDISAPPGAAGGLEEEVEPESFEKQSELEPQFWQDSHLEPKIAKRLIKIASDFVDGLDIDEDLAHELVRKLKPLKQISELSLKECGIVNATAKIIAGQLLGDLPDLSLLK